MRKCILSMFIILIVFSNLYSEDSRIKTEVLQPVRAVPDEDSNEPIYFRVLPFIAVNDKGCIYAADNNLNKIYLISFRGKYIKNIGRKGVGPGDINLPIKLGYTNDKLIVLDNVGFSCFDKKGRFLYKFRNYGFTMEFAINSNYIFSLCPYNKKIITMFNYKGKIICKFGEKFKINEAKSGKNIIPVYSIYDGRIAADNHYAYLLYTRIAEIYKYDFQGKLISKKILNFNDRKIDKKVKINRDYIFHVKKNKIQSIVESIYLYDNKLYLLINKSIIGKNTLYGLIKVFDTKIFNLIKTYIFKNINKEKRFVNSGFQFVVKNINGIDYFFIPISYGLERKYIGIYKTKNK